MVKSLKKSSEASKLMFTTNIRKCFVIFGESDEKFVSNNGTLN